MKISRAQATSRFQKELSDLATSDARKNLLREILQEVILCHMKEAGLFLKYMSRNYFEILRGPISITFFEYFFGP